MSEENRNEDVAQLPYEAARDELVGIVRAMEAGSTPLEETLAMWERGEALAARCQQILDQAEAKLSKAAGEGAN
ncbi:MAG: exodeoxyribonuclease VII small subunit [Actinomycetaceae bacterium]|nr:exodeoxyribonuclease VII small subunit [Actinomycetaceae bacterium]